MAISDLDAAKALQAAGFTGMNLVIAVAVAKGESGPEINPAAIARESNGSTSYGMMQINSVHPDVLRMGSWQNANDNARMAFRIWTESRNSWIPWGAYNSLRYQLFMEKANKAVGQLGANTGTPPTTATPVDNVPGLGSAAESISAFFRFVSDPHNWFRLSMVLLGGALIGLAALMSIKDSDSVQTMAKVAMKAVPL